MVSVDIDRQLRQWADDAADLATPVTAADAIARSEAPLRNGRVGGGGGWCCSWLRRWVPSRCGLHPATPRGIGSWRTMATCRRPRRRTVRLDLTTGTWQSWPGPIHDGGGYSDAAVVAGSVVYFADESGDVQQLPFGDGPSAAWRLTNRHEPRDCAPQVLVVDDQPFVDVCVAQQWFTPAGQWVDATGGIDGCCYDDLASAGPVLFQWLSNDDTANDPSAPRTRARIWRPPAGGHPPSIFDDRGRPIEPRSPADARRLEAAVAGRFADDLDASFDGHVPQIGDACSTAATDPTAGERPLGPVAGGDPDGGCVIAGFAYRSDVLADLVAFDEWGFAAIPIFDADGGVIDFFDRTHQVGLAWMPPGCTDVSGTDC